VTASDGAVSEAHNCGSVAGLRQSAYSDRVRRGTARLYQGLYDEGYDPHLDLRPAVAIVGVVGFALALLTAMIAFFVLLRGFPSIPSVYDIFSHASKHHCLNGEGRCVPMQ
jgi:hypothetical protein